MPASNLHRTIAKGLALLLAIGFVYSGLAVARGYRDLLRSPLAAGSGATVDPYLAPVKLKSAQEFREAVSRAGWDAGQDLLLVPPASTALPQDIGQIHFVAGYLLFPRRVWLASDSHLDGFMLVGQPDRFRDAPEIEISDTLSVKR